MTWFGRELIVRLGEPETEGEARTRLARIGFDSVIGALDDYVRAFIARPDLVAQGSRLTANELADRIKHEPSLQLVDVRNPGEVAEGSIPSARAIPLARLRERIDELDPDVPTVAYCAGGYRSSIAASTLRANGFRDVSDLLAGFDAWTSTGHGVGRDTERDVNRT